MYLIKKKNKIKIISKSELSQFALKKDWNIIMELKEYPSLKKTRVDERGDIKDFLFYLERKIQECDNKKKNFEKQLKEFKNDCEGLL